MSKVITQDTFTMVSDQIFDSTLNSTDKLILSRILRFTDNNRPFFMSDEKLAFHTTYTVKTIGHSISRLKALPFISVVHQNELNEHGCWVNIRYIYVDNEKMNEWLVQDRQQYLEGLGAQRQEKIELQRTRRREKKADLEASVVTRTPVVNEPKEVVSVDNFLESLEEVVPTIIKKEDYFTELVQEDSAPTDDVVSLANKIIQDVSSRTFLNTFQRMKYIDRALANADTRGWPMTEYDLLRKTVKEYDYTSVESFADAA